MIDVERLQMDYEFAVGAVLSTALTLVDSVYGTSNPDGDLCQKTLDKLCEVVYRLRIVDNEITCLYRGQLQ
jgi:hypothetical protein